MKSKTITRMLLVTVMTALLLISSAAGLAMGQLVWCPEPVEWLKN
jgi:hypothetical protein